MTSAGGEGFFAVFAVFAVRFAHRDASSAVSTSTAETRVVITRCPSTTSSGSPCPSRHVVLVDAGFTAETAARRGGRDYLQSPMDTLRALGVDPAAVAHLVVTHLHYDHVGHISDFPAARVLLQRAEYEFWPSPVAERG